MLFNWHISFPEGLLIIHRLITLNKFSFNRLLISLLDPTLWNSHGFLSYRPWMFGSKWIMDRDTTCEHRNNKEVRLSLLNPDSFLYFTPLNLPNKMSRNRSDRSRGPHWQEEPNSSGGYQLSCYRFLAWFPAPTSLGKKEKHETGYAENWALRADREKQRLLVTMDAIFCLV